MYMYKEKSFQLEYGNLCGYVRGIWQSKEDVSPPFCQTDLPAEKAPTGSRHI